MHRGRVLEFVGMTCVFTHNPSFRQTLQTPTQCDDCAEASQKQSMFSCGFFCPSVNQLQHSHHEVLRGEAQRFLEAAFKTANDNELSQEPSGVGLCCHAGCFYWN